ncbi:hypothetical protein R69619_06071 [Paraburkholderia nemoris]|uniref:hypothetical protein n=1 Tax=Paraburkholderia nemoris TaxID=2793076 RepID=UPI001B248C3C|nr:hypothetical protein [Paraburkholderia nemoris]CAE6820040.1 hypothetical protein R69619_06071 [Paraburkholderia nemoris]
MTTVSSLITANLSPGSLSLNSIGSTVSATKLVTEETAATPESSTVVTISQAGATSPLPEYSASPTNESTARTLTLANNSNDSITMAMAGDVLSASLTNNKFYGLGSALLERFKTTGGDFLQSVQIAPANPVSSIGQTVQGSQADIRLTIQTKSGVEVDITLHSQDGSLTVGVKSNGKLTDAERSALAKLSGSFQDAIDGLSAIPPRLNLSGLTQFDPSVLSSVDLQSSVPVKGQPLQSIDFHADSAARTVSVIGPTGAMKISVDMSNSAIWGNQAQRTGAINQYLSQFDKTSSRGHGDASLMTMFKDAFTQMNSDYGVPSQQIPGTTYATSLGDADHAMLTGLADFNASITQAPTEANPMRLNEQDTFSYQVSQHTNIKGSELYGTISQNQRSHLAASYHMSLSAGAPLALTSMRSSQNYYYMQINDAAASTTYIASRNGELTDASLNQTADQSTRQSKYVMGRLVSDTIAPFETSRSKDLLALLKPFLESDKPKSQGDIYLWQQTLSDVHNLVLPQPDSSA